MTDDEFELLKATTLAVHRLDKILKHTNRALRALTIAMVCVVVALILHLLSHHLH